MLAPRLVLEYSFSLGSLNGSSPGQRAGDGNKVCDWKLLNDI